MTLVSGDRIYVSPMDTLGLLLLFMTISILTKSLFPETIFFFFPLPCCHLCSSISPSFTLLFHKRQIFTMQSRLPLKS